MRIWCVPVCGLLLIGCTGPAVTRPESTATPPKITQFYATEPSIARGEKGKLCYGVENARSVWISPPRQELSAALVRCIEVEPAGKTTYTLTAEGADGQKVSQDVTIGIGAAKVKLINVNITATQVHPGETVG